MFNEIHEFNGVKIEWSEQELKGINKKRFEESVIQYGNELISLLIDHVSYRDEMMELLKERRKQNGS